MFVTNTRDGVRTSDNSYTPWYDHIGDSLLFPLPPKILDTLTYVRFYKFDGRKGTDSALTALMLHQNGDFD